MLLIIKGSKTIEKIKDSFIYKSTIYSLQGAVAQFAANQTRNSRAILENMHTGFFHMHYTIHRIYGYLKDKAII